MSIRSSWGSVLRFLNKLNLRVVMICSRIANLRPHP